jgi:hypothetical protein
MDNDSCPFGMHYRERITKAFRLRDKEISCLYVKGLKAPS